MYIQLKNDVLEAMPGCVNNPYIKTSMKEFYQLLVELLDCDVHLIYYIRWQTILEKCNMYMAMLLIF